MLKIIRTSIEKFLLSPAYFILFSIYPVLGIYANNVHGVLLIDLIRPLITSLFFALLLFRVLQLAIHHSQTSALIVLSIFFIFFYYGHVRGLLNIIRVPVRDDILAVAWLFLISLTLALIVRNKRR